MAQTPEPDEYGRIQNENGHDVRPSSSSGTTGHILKFYNTRQSFFEQLACLSQRASKGK